MSVELSTNTMSNPDTSIFTDSPTSSFRESPTPAAAYEWTGSRPPTNGELMGLLAHEAERQGTPSAVAFVPDRPLPNDHSVRLLGLAIDQCPATTRSDLAVFAMSWAARRLFAKDARGWIVPQWFQDRPEWVAQKFAALTGEDIAGLIYGTELSDELARALADLIMGAAADTLSSKEGT